jgi:hypothetical protein
MHIFESRNAVHKRWLVFGLAALRSGPHVKLITSSQEDQTGQSKAAYGSTFLRR